MIIKESIESEFELISGIKRGDELAKSKFVKEYYPILFQYISTNFGRKLSKHEISDIATDALLRAMQKIDKFTVGASLKSWLIKIASRAFFSYNRKATSPKHSVVQNSYELSETSYQDDRLKSSEDKDFIRRFKETLSPIENSYLDLFLKGYTHKEVAEILNGTEVTSRWYKNNLTDKMTKWSKAGEPTIKIKPKAEKSEKKLKAVKGPSKPDPVKIKKFLDYLENKNKKRED